MLRKVKITIHDIFYPQAHHTSFIYKVDDYVINTIILLNVLAIILESFEGVFQKYSNFFYYFELFSVVLFTIEYILRIWVADFHYEKLTPFKARMKYIFSFMGIVDLLAILPFYLPFIFEMDLRSIRILRLIRLFRILKLAHYSESLQLIGLVFVKKKQEILITFIGSLMILLVTSSIMFKLEHNVQPENFTNILTTMWWAVATLTTIGYGDIYPITSWGRLLAGITAIFGIGLIAIPTGILSAGFLEEMSNKKKYKTNPRQRKLQRKKI